MINIRRGGSAEREREREIERKRKWQRDRERNWEIKEREREREGVMYSTFGILIGDQLERGHGKSIPTSIVGCVISLLTLSLSLIFRIHED